MGMKEKRQTWGEIDQGGWQRVRREVENQKSKQRIVMRKKTNLGRNPSRRLATCEERGRRVAAQLLPVALK